MILGLCVLAGVLLAGGICLGTGAFLTLSWLWTLPVWFLIGFLGGVLVAAIILVAMSLAVPMDVLPEKDSKLYRWVAHLYIKALKAILRLKITEKGMEQWSAEGRCLLVCNHTADIDPVVLLHCFKSSRLAFISKRENDKKPIVAQFMRKLMCQPINRENDREALKTILRCVQLINEDEVSVGVFPEGYESLDGKLRRFRSGVFKIAQKAKVPIVVCTLHNARPAMKRMLRGKASQVELHLIRVIYPEEFAGMTTVALGDMIYEMMAEDLGPENVYDYSKET